MDGVEFRALDGSNALVLDSRGIELLTEPLSSIEFVSRVVTLKVSDLGVAFE